MKTIITTLFLGLAVSAQAQMAHTVFVGEGGFKFVPNAMEVSVGDTVRFKYFEGFHTTTSTSVPDGAATWDKPMSANGDLFDYVVKMAGTYNYKCTPHGSMMTGSFTATVTGVEKQSVIAKQSVSMAPNPASDKTVLSFNSENAFAGALKVTNAMGNAVYSENVNVATGANQFLLNAENLNAGMYFVNLSNQNGVVLTERLIKKFWFEV